MTKLGRHNPYSAWLISVQPDICKCLLFPLFVAFCDSVYRFSYVSHLPLFRCVLSPFAAFSFTHLPNPLTLPLLGFSGKSQFFFNADRFCVQVLRRDTGFLAFSFPRSLGSGVYDEINGGQRKFVRTYLSYISTKFRPIWMRFGARVNKKPCQTLYPWVSVLARCFAYACTKAHPNRSKFGGDIVQINAHRFLLSPINFIIDSTSQRPWEQKGQKTRVTP